jgi:TIR domain
LREVVSPSFLLSAGDQFISARPLLGSCCDARHGGARRVVLERCNDREGNRYKYWIVNPGVVQDATMPLFSRPLEAEPRHCRFTHEFERSMGGSAAMTPGTIFISHRAEYGSLVKELKKAIETTSRGQIRVFISEELRGAEDWREAIKQQLADAQSLFLLYGAPYEDWSWCFYEAGYFAGIDAGQKQPRRIYCISRPNVAAPGPLNELQMVTNIDGLLKDLMDIYDENKVSYNPVQLRQSICEAGRRLFGQLEEFTGYPRVYFVADDSDFGAAADLPAGAALTGDRVLLTQLFGIGKDAVPWDEIAKTSGDDRTPQEQMFFCKWLEETKKIILAAREHIFKAPQTVLIARAGLRVRFLLYQARIQGDGSYCCEFLVINEVGGPALGLSRQLLALVTSIRLGFRFRYELIKRFGNEPDRLSDADRRARIQEIPRIIENLMTESESRGNIALEDLQSAFDDDDADRIGKLVGYWPFLQEQLYSALGVSADGKPVSDQGLLGHNLEKYRLAFDSMRLLNLEFLSLCCARVSRMMMRPPEELKKNAETLENNVRALSPPPVQAAA